MTTLNPTEVYEFHVRIISARDLKRVASTQLQPFVMVSTNSSIISYSTEEVILTLTFLFLTHFFVFYLEGNYSFKQRASYTISCGTGRPKSHLGL